MKLRTTVLGWVGTLVLCSTGFGAVAFAQEAGSGESPTGSSMLEVMREEILDTISLDRPVHFTTPQTTDTIVTTGTYQVLTQDGVRHEYGLI